MNRNRVTRILAAGGASLIAFCALPGTANAQFSPCALLGPGGAFMPPPCIKTDIKRLADTATQNAQELQKIAETVNTIQQAKAATEGIVSDVQGLASTKFDISVPNVDTNAGPILEGMKGDIAGFATKMGDTFFAGADASVEDAQQAQRKRDGVLADAVVDGFAYGAQGVGETDAANTRYASLSKKACKSKDLRGDWNVNSEIKIELMNARARQAYLYSSYLRMASAEGVNNVTTRSPQGYNQGTTVGQTLDVGAAISKAAQVVQLIDLLSKARGIMGSLSVVTMAASAIQTVQDDTKAYNDYIAFMEQKKADLPAFAKSWHKHSDKCSTSEIVNAINSGKSADVEHCIKGTSDHNEYYSMAYGVAKTNDAYAQMDPQHWNYQPGLDFYNVEKAYREEQLQEERAQLVDLQARVEEENAKQGTVIDAASATRDLTDIVNQANGIGQEVGAGQDPGAKQQAADLLRQLQELMAQGTSLPAVDVTPVTTPIEADPATPVEPGNSLQ